ncbi:MAG: cell division protein DivIVA [Candidatus Nephrothrix sp. EaCA]|nr:MAG: cell division protein DivIVA [Candidatus Nephrothrix sp. EaCA]
MKITPIEIRQKTFEKVLRGYDKDEVTAFLQTLSQEWERLVEEGKGLRQRLENSVREVAKLREVEDSLFKTLKTAESTRDSMVEQAQKSAQLLLKESELKADAMLYEARQKAKDVMEEAESLSKDMLYETEKRLKDLAQEYKTLHAHRENLMNDLVRLANDTVERVNRTQLISDKFSPDEYIAGLKKEAFRPHIEPMMKAVEREAPPKAAEPREVRKAVMEVSAAAQKSFFDEFE